MGLACLIFKRKSWHAYFSNQEEYTYLCIYRFLFEVFQFLNVGNTSLFLKKHGGSQVKHGFRRSLCSSAEPSLFAWPSASSMQKGITENSAQGPQSRQSPLGHVQAGNLGIVVPFDLDDQGPTSPTLWRVTSHCPPTHEEEEGLLGQGICPPRAHTPSSRPASDSWGPQKSLHQRPRARLPDQCISFPLL